MIDIKSYQSVAVGSTVAECQQVYKTLLASNGVDLQDGADPVIADRASGEIARMVEAVVEGNSHFYVQLQGDDMLYDFALPGLVDIVGYEVGDSISFTYIKNDGISPVKEIEKP